jgi:hypothetical protein
MYNFYLFLTLNILNNIETQYNHWIKMIWRNPWRMPTEPRLRTTALGVRDQVTGGTPKFKISSN